MMRLSQFRGLAVLFASVVACDLVAQTPLPRPPARTDITVMPTGPAPERFYITGSPAWATISWGVPVTLRGLTYSVQRWMESDPACCNAKVDNLINTRWMDEGLQWPGTYIYRVTVFYPDGSRGSADARWVRPNPVNPANFRATASKGQVILQWDAVPDVSWYNLFGPGLSSGSFQVTGVTSFVVRKLAKGTHSWRIASYYSSPNAPAPVSSAAAEFPQVTVVVPN